MERKLAIIYDKLTNSDVPKEWYSIGNASTGIAWHFTDINNMASILARGFIGSKNMVEEKEIIKNDNSSIEVNRDKTADWVHNYARFYLRPKTPTQYRNEGIYPSGSINPNLCGRLLRNGDLWSDPPAHLPIPVFIGFDLKTMIDKGAKLTKGTLAGKVNRRYEDCVDEDLSYLAVNIRDIYSNQSYTADIIKKKHTELIFENGFHFDSKDILSIVVRTEAEKLGLLTLLMNESTNLSLTKEERDKLDIDKYWQKIIVHPSFFYMDAGYFDLDQSANLIFKNFDKNNVYKNEIDYKFTRNRKSVVVKKLKNYKYKIIDIREQEIELINLHDPMWILDMDRYKNRYYYSRVYLNGKYIVLYRDSGSLPDQWLEKGTNKIIDLTPDQVKILREVEESVRVSWDHS